MYRRRDTCLKRCNKYVLRQGSPNFLSKGLVKCPSGFREGGLWPSGVESAPALVPIIGCNERNSAPSLVVMEGIVPH